MNEPDMAVAARKAEEIYLKLIDEEKPSNKGIAEAINDINEVPEQILDLIEKFQKQYNYQFDVLYNDIQHQHGNTECGIYCLHFLTEMLKGKGFRNYVNQKNNDKEIEKFRKLFFIER